LNGIYKASFGTKEKHMILKDNISTGKNCGAV
jgi:hypothetical protein